MPQLRELLSEPLVPSGVQIVPTSHPGTARPQPRPPVGAAAPPALPMGWPGLPRWDPGIPGGMQGPQKDAGTSSRIQGPRWDAETMAGCRESWWDTGTPVGCRDFQQDPGTPVRSRDPIGMQRLPAGCREPGRMQGPQWDAGIPAGCRTPSGCRDPGRAASGPSVLCGGGFLWLLPVAPRCPSPGCPAPALPAIPAELTEFQENSALTQGHQWQRLPVLPVWSCAGYLEQTWRARPSSPQKVVKNLHSFIPLPLVLLSPKWRRLRGRDFSCSPFQGCSRRWPHTQLRAGAVGSSFPKGGVSGKCANGAAPAFPASLQLPVL